LEQLTEGTEGLPRASFAETNFTLTPGCPLIQCIALLRRGPARPENNPILEVSDLAILNYQRPAGCEIDSEVAAGPGPVDGQTAQGDDIARTPR
jgi:hypothetical protein